MSWNATRLGAASAWGVLGFVLNVGIGLPIILATGIPAGAFPVMLFLFPMMVIMCGLLIPLFPSCTIAMAVWLILALSVPIMGPPGFLPKIIVGVGAGLVLDVFLLFLRNRERIASIVGGLLVDIVALALAASIFYFFLPAEAAMKFIKLLTLAFVLAVILGPAGGFVGWKIFDRIRDRAIVVRLRGE